MSLFHFAWRYLVNRPLVTLLTIIGVALGSGLISTVLTLRSETQRTFLEASYTFDIVVGAKGSPLQMVLSSLYHIDVPTGNIPYEEYEKITEDFRVEKAIPIGLGDNYQGFRFIGTTNEFFEVENRDVDGDSVPLFDGGDGRLELQDSFDAILGSDVAAMTGLKIGDTFSGTHGLMALAGSESHDEFPYTVVGIFNRTGTPHDRGIYTTLDAVWAIHDAEEMLHASMGSTPSASEENGDGDDAESEEAFWAFAPVEREQRKEVTAVLVQLKAAGLRFQFKEEISEETDAMAAIPIEQMFRLYNQILAPVEKSLLAVAYLVVVVAVLSVLTSLYQAGERRRRDIAIMRSLGAFPSEVFLIVLFEAILVTAGGVLLGAILGHGGLAIANKVILQQSGLPIRPFVVTSTELIALGVVLAAGILAGLLPSIMAYRGTPVRDLNS